MTDHDKATQAGTLILAAQEAKKDLAHKRERLLAMKDALDDVARWLWEAAADKGLETSDNEKTIRADVGRYRELLDFDAILRAVDEVREARRKARELESRKASLGLTS